ncbi:MAG TPA: hypothetical protein VFW49_05090, partial [Fluviicoccus sp.]|nr:hypothetical protein [Fluviicoccus sp.]
LGGDDTYWLERGTSQDIVVDSLGNADALLCGSDIRHDQLWFSRQSNDLVVNVMGTADGLRISNWFLTVANGNTVLEDVIAGDGYHLNVAGVGQLVSAMATMTPPAAGQTELTAQQHQQLDTLLASNWQG